MIYNDRFIFVHVPKTGGQSVYRALGGRTGGGLPTHTPLRCVEKGHRLAFGFVRNPWERMVSLYEFLCQKQFRRTDNFDQWAVRTMGFKSWLLDDEFFMQEDDHPLGEPWVMRTHWRGDGGAPLPPMQRRPQSWWLEGCDVIGMAANLDDELNMVLSEVGMDPVSVPRVNQTRHGDWREYYDADTAAHVARFFAPDIDRWGFQGPSV